MIYLKVRTACESLTSTSFIPNKGVLFDTSVYFPLQIHV